MRLRRDQGGKLCTRKSRELRKLRLVDGRPFNFQIPLNRWEDRACSRYPRNWHCGSRTPGTPASPAPRLGAVAFHFGRVGLDLVAAVAAPQHERRLRRGGATHRHRPDAVGSHEPVAYQTRYSTVLTAHILRCRNGLLGVDSIRWM
jgi:hypothetical protein